MSKDTIILEITNEDIEFGRRKSPFHCPIALAGKRVFGRKVSVGRIVRVESKWWEGFWKDQPGYTLTKEAKEFMYLFDIGKSVKPITIELRRL